MFQGVLLLVDEAQK
jgi:hypothetical protein